MTQIMKTFIIAAALFCMISCAESGEKHEIHVIPEPLNMEAKCGNLNVCDASFWLDEDLDTDSGSAITSFFARLSNATSSKCTQSADRGNSTFRFKHISGLEPEAYQININKKNATIKASSFKGFLYALETIKQMLPLEIYSDKPAPDASWSLPCVKIEDCPRFGYRGMHLDVARHFWTVDQVKKYLDIMALHKMNTFHWHLTDDQGWRVEIKKYPHLTEVGSKRRHTAIGRGWYNIEYDGIPHEGYYTQDEIKDIVKYAASKGISIIPEIDLPGHMLAAIASYPELGCTGGPYEVWGRWGISSDVLCVGKESTFGFIEDILSEIIELFPSEYIHIGGDECPKVRWKECPHCLARMAGLGLDPKEESSAEKLQGYVTNRVLGMLAERGKRIIGWDEILSGDISTNAVIMSWRGVDGGMAASRAGHDVIMTPNCYCYFDYYQSRKMQEEPFAIGGFVDVKKNYFFEPFTPEMTEEQKSHILGVQANLWTEYIQEPEHLEYMLLPRMSGLSELQWCSTENRDYQHFLDKMGHMREIYEILGYNYAKHIFEVTPVIGVDVEHGCPVVELRTQGDAPMYYTLDGSEPTVNSTRYTEPVKIIGTDIFKAIVDREGVETKVLTQTFSKHKATGKAIKMNTMPDPLYSDGLPGSLVNGVVNEGENAHGGEWMAWKGDPIDVVIDMNGETYNNVSVRAYTSKWEDLFGPLGLVVSVSEDGKSFEEVASLDIPLEASNDPDGVKTYEISFPTTSAKYLNVVLETVAQLPSWSERPGRPAYLFIDEIKVE